jgi:hypothetical protein
LRNTQAQALHKLVSMGFPKGLLLLVPGSVSVAFGQLDREEMISLKQPNPHTTIPPAPGPAWSLFLPCPADSRICGELGSSVSEPSQ